MKKPFIPLLTMCLIFSTGCVGFNVPQPFSRKPYTYFKGGDQLGRDQLANRALVATTKKLVLKDHSPNDVLSLLGQPQNVQVMERGISEDWHFTYYKRYLPYNPLNKVPPFGDEKGEFIVRFYHDKVVDVVKTD